MKRIIEAFERLQRRFDFSGNARLEKKAMAKAKSKRPPKRKRRR